MRIVLKSKMNIIVSPLVAQFVEKVAFGSSKPLYALEDGEFTENKIFFLFVALLTSRLGL
jgi:hypothetical protein